MTQNEFEKEKIRIDKYKKMDSRLYQLSENQNRISFGIAKITASYCEEIDILDEPDYFKDVLKNVIMEAYSVEIATIQKKMEEI